MDQLTEGSNAEEHWPVANSFEDRGWPRPAVQTSSGSRLQKTRLWFAGRDGFLDLLTRDLAKVERVATKHAERAAVRLNVFQ